MSSVEATAKPLRRIPKETKAAILAALGSGKTQSETAQRFGVHYNSVHNLWKLVKAEAAKSPETWKDSILPTAQQAVERGITHTADPIGAMNGALKLMHGIGYLSSDSKVHVDGNVALQVSWLPVQAPTEDAEILSISESDTSAETND